MTPGAYRNQSLQIERLLWRLTIKTDSRETIVHLIKSHERDDIDEEHEIVLESWEVAELVAQLMRQQLHARE